MHLFSLPEQKIYHLLAILYLARQDGYRSNVSVAKLGNGVNSSG